MTNNKSARRMMRAATKRTRAMALMTRVAGDKEGEGDGGNSNGDGDEGQGRAMATRVMATATTWAMATATRVAGDEEGEGKGKWEGKDVKGDGDRDEGGEQQRGRGVGRQG
jgi:hypothetical protein